jgi:hypothetical protein
MGKNYHHERKVHSSLYKERYTYTYALISRDSFDGLLILSLAKREILLLVWPKIKIEKHI